MVGSFNLSGNVGCPGTVKVEKQGLYYRFSCRCQNPGAGMYRLQVQTSVGNVDLGLCVPVDGAFGMEKRMACKHFGSGDPVFTLVPDGLRKEEAGKLVAVYPEEPFSYLHRLQDAFLEIRDGQPYIRLRE